MNTHSIAFVLPRYTGISILAGLTTCLLFLAMYALIATDSPELEESIPIKFNPIMEPPKEPDVIKKEPVERIPDPALAPEIEPLSNVIDFSDNLVNIPNNVPDIGKHSIDGSMGSSSIVPIFRVQPDYPRRAITRGIQGFVDLVFDVSATGRTENIRVLAAEPSGVFERAAIRALKKWKYKPPMDDGVPYSQPDMTTRITFSLEGEA